MNEEVENMRVKIVNRSDNDLPQYASNGAAGVDLRAHLDNAFTLQPMERTLVKTGLFLEIPQGYEGQVRPRSGMALKKGITVLNSPGTIDADYRGEVGVILINMSQRPFVIENGDRVAQLVFAKVEQSDWELVEELETTSRGSGGFGSTGKK